MIFCISNMKKELEKKGHLKQTTKVIAMKGLLDLTKKMKMIIMANC